MTIKKANYEPCEWVLNCLYCGKSLKWKYDLSDVEEEEVWCHYCHGTFQVTN